MITYNRSACGLNLIFRVHGSAVYRSILPSLVSVGFFFLIQYRYQEEASLREQQDLGHPYAMGVLVSSVTFLIVFRASQGYARYMEGASSVFHMMSKFMDASIHSGVYHLQCDHYKDIKPPSFFDYPELNHLFLTRDRERGPDYYAEDFEDENDDDDISLRPGFRSNSYPQDRQSTGRGIGGRESGSGGGRGMVRDFSSRMSFNYQEKKVERKVQELKQKEQRQRAKVRSINSLNNSGVGSSVYSSRGSKPHLGQRHSNLPDIGESEGPSNHDRSMDSQDDDFVDEFLDSKQVLGDRPTPLVGKPRLDGNWSHLYKDNRQVFYAEEDNLQGFASIDGGRTPPLFLQELAHLSSLLVAVAFSTLRNDMEGLESPLSFYQPGQPWPEVDPDKDELLKQRGFKTTVKNIRTFVGMGRSGKEQARYNAARPFPVLGGVSDAEIKFLQMARGPYAKTQLCWNWLSEFIIREHLAGSMGAVGPPIISRIIQFLGDGMIYYNHARKIMFIPFPFPHAQLSVMFIVVLVPCIPFLMDQYVDDAWLAAILTFLTVMCLAGIHEVARDLENPFRNVPNELPLVTFQAEYNEALITMYSGWHPGQFWDGDKLLRQQKIARKQQSKPIAKCNSNNDNDASSSDHGAEIAELKRQLTEQSKLIQELTQAITFDRNKEHVKLEREKKENPTPEREKMKNPTLERENSFHPRRESREETVLPESPDHPTSHDTSSSDKELDSKKESADRKDREDMVGDVDSVNSIDSKNSALLEEKESPDLPTNHDASSSDEDLDPDKESADRMHRVDMVGDVYSVKSNDLKNSALLEEEESPDHLMNHDAISSDEEHRLGMVGDVYSVNSLLEEEEMAEIIGEVGEA
jgi:predicted membrane chloride channel (bestrophin family)